MSAIWPLKPTLEIQVTNIQSNRDKVEDLPYHCEQCVYLNQTLLFTGRGKDEYCTLQHKTTFTH